MIENLYVGMLAVCVAGAATYPRARMQAQMWLDKLKEEPTDPKTIWSAAILDVIMGLCVAYVIWVVLFTLLAGHPHPFDVDVPTPSWRLQGS